MNDSPAWLASARAEFSRLQPDAAQDAALLVRLTGQLQAQHAQRLAHEKPPTRWQRRLAWGGGALGAMAALVLSTVLLLDPPGSRGEPVVIGTGSGFIPLVPEREFQLALTASRSAAVWLQPAELPRERLALLGLPFDAARADETVRAELMLHPSGQLLAVRFLP